MDQRKARPETALHAASHVAATLERIVAALKAGQAKALSNENVKAVQPEPTPQESFDHSLRRLLRAFDETSSGDLVNSIDGPFAAVVVTRLLVARHYAEVVGEKARRNSE